MVAVVDRFSRRVVSTAMTAQLATDALVMAIWRCSGGLNANHGVVAREPVEQRWDNGAMESVFSSLNTELTARKIYRTRNNNPRRRHSTIGYFSSVEFEMQAG